MVKGKLEQLDEQVKAQHKYLQSMSPAERRAAFIQARNAQDKNAQKSILMLAVIGVLFLAGAIQQWLVHYHASLLSSLGFLCGVFLAIVGLRYIQVNRIQSTKIIQLDNFTDEDLTAYFREHEEINKRAVEQWHRRGKYLVLIVFGTMVVASNFRSTTEFLLVALFSGLSIFLLSLVVFSIVQNRSIAKAARQNGG